MLDVNLASFHRQSSMASPIKTAPEADPELTSKWRDLRLCFTQKSRQKMPDHVRQMNTLCHRSKLMLACLDYSANRFFAISIYSGTQSIATKLRPDFLATSAVVPAPEKGSSTTPSGGQLAFMQVSTNDSG